MLLLIMGNFARRFAEPLLLSSLPVSHPSNILHICTTKTEALLRLNRALNCGKVWKCFHSKRHFSHVCSRKLPDCGPRPAMGISDRLFVYVVLIDCATPASRQHREQNLSMQPAMLIALLFKARASPLSALQCQRSSDAVNWLMTRTPRATASSLIYT